jgi:hypothetical protein
MALLRKVYRMCGMRSMPTNGLIRSRVLIGRSTMV